MGRRQLFSNCPAQPMPQVQRLIRSSTTCCRCSALTATLQVPAMLLVIQGPAVTTKCLFCCGVLHVCVTTYRACILHAGSSAHESNTCAELVSALPRPCTQAAIRAMLRRAPALAACLGMSWMPPTHAFSAVRRNWEVALPGALLRYAIYACQLLHCTALHCTALHCTALAILLVCNEAF
jgi:hypothetical protein